MTLLPRTGRFVAEPALWDLKENGDDKEVGGGGDGGVVYVCQTGVVVVVVAVNMLSSWDTPALKSGSTVI